MSAALTALIARCRVLCRPRSQADDAELLRRFTQQRDAAAFEELLERHAALVWGVCRRILPNEADCEDAFQATFLALVRRADAVEARPSLGAWLHTVALRVARKARMRSQRQQQQAFVPEPATAGDVADEVGNRELFRLVDEEIERLPAAVREPIVLCCLQGRTRDEAAEMLGCSIAAVKSRLERGRNLLRRRLEQRGVQLPAAFVVLGLTTERIRAMLWAKSMQSVLHTPAPEIVSLAEAGVSAAMIGKAKLFLVVLLLAASAAGAAGMLMREKPAEAPAFPQAKPAAVQPKKPEAPQERTDRHGDPLPDGALARLGTVRWRHGFFVHELAYSPDGRKIAAVGCGRAITLWDSATGKELLHFPNRNQPQSLAFSPDSSILATTDTQVCRLWDLASGKEIRQLKGHQESLVSVAFSLDGKQIATSDGTLRIWDAATGKEQRKIELDSGGVCRLAYSPDGKWIAATSRAGTIHLWDPTTGKEHRQFKEHKKESWAIAFSPDGKQLASSSGDGTIRLWDVATGRQLRPLAEGLDYSYTPIAFSPDGTLLAGGCRDGTIRLWNVKDGAEQRRWQAGVISVKAIAFSPDGKTLASGAAWSNIRLWDLATGEERNPSEGHLGFVDFVRFSPDGATLVSISRDRLMLSWDLATQKVSRRFTWADKGLSRAVLSPDASTLATLGWWVDSEVRLWNVRSGKPGRSLGKQPKNSWGIAFSPDGRLVAAAGNDHIIHVWDAKSGQEVRRIIDVPNEVIALCFSPDSKALACGTRTNGITNVSVHPSLHLWDVATGKERCSFDAHVSIAVAVAFSPDGKVIATGEDNRDHSLVRLWDATSGKELCRHSGHSEGIGAVAFSPDGKLVASGAGDVAYRDNSVHVWEAATGRLIRRFEGHHSCVGSVAFSPDGLTVASGAGDSTILLWDITGRRIDGRWHTKSLTSSQLAACWKALANEDAAKGYDAVWAFVAAPDQAIPFLRKHLPPVPRPDAKTVARLISELDSDDFAVRQKATEELTKLGDAIAPALRQALERKPTLEMRRRIQQLLDQTRQSSPERLRDHRAIQALEHIGTRPAKEILQALAEGASEARRTEEAKAALQRLSRDRKGAAPSAAP